jgi:hypothetical protein
MAKKLEEQQKQQGWEDLVKSGYATQQQDYEGALRGQKGTNVSLAEGYQPTPEIWKQLYQGQTGKSNVPPNFMKYALNQENIPSGMTVDVPGGLAKYTKPDTFKAEKEERTLKNQEKAKVQSANYTSIQAKSSFIFSLFTL